MRHRGSSPDAAAKGGDVKLAGASWLMTDAHSAFATGLSKHGRTGSGLLSPTTIADGNWHRIAFIWDGTERRLYVDEVFVAEDVQGSLAGSASKLVVGAGKDMAPTSFFSALIDNERIYNRVVEP